MTALSVTPRREDSWNWMENWLLFRDYEKTIHDDEGEKSSMSVASIDLDTYDFMADPSSSGSSSCTARERSEPQSAISPSASSPCARAIASNAVPWWGGQSSKTSSSTVGVASLKALEAPLATPVATCSGSHSSHPCSAQPIRTCPVGLPLNGDVTLRMPGSYPWVTETPQKAADLGGLR